MVGTTRSDVRQGIEDLVRSITGKEVWLTGVLFGWAANWDRMMLGDLQIGRVGV